MLCSVVFVGQRQKPSWCLATTTKPRMPPSLHAPTIWSASNRVGFRSAGSSSPYPHSRSVKVFSPQWTMPMMSSSASRRMRCAGLGSGAAAAASAPSAAATTATVFILAGIIANPTATRRENPPSPGTVPTPPGQSPTLHPGTVPLLLVPLPLLLGTVPMAGTAVDAVRGGDRPRLRHTAAARGNAPPRARRVRHSRSFAGSDMSRRIRGIYPKPTPPRFCQQIETASVLVTPPSATPRRAHGRP